MINMFQTNCPACKDSLIFNLSRNKRTFSLRCDKDHYYFKIITEANFSTHVEEVRVIVRTKEGKIQQSLYIINKKFYNVDYRNSKFNSFFIYVNGEQVEKSSYISCQSEDLEKLLALL